MTAYQVAEYYTLAEIDAKIVEYQDAYDASLMGGYRLDTTQGAQSRTPPDPARLSEALALWLKARAIKSGTYTGTQIIHANYTP